MTVTCAHCGKQVRLKQKEGLSPIGKCKNCNTYVIAVGMGLTDEARIKEFEKRKK